MVTLTLFSRSQRSFFTHNAITWEQFDRGWQNLVYECIWKRSQTCLKWLIMTYFLSLFQGHRGQFLLLKAITNWRKMIKLSIWMHLRKVSDKFKNGWYWPTFQGHSGHFKVTEVNMLFFTHWTRYLENKLT